ncbi:hypothetical protein ACTJKB_19600 [Paenibacillus sp. 22594]
MNQTLKSAALLKIIESAKTAPSAQIVSLPPQIYFKSSVLLRFTQYSWSGFIISWSAAPGFKQKRVTAKYSVNAF